MAKNIFSLLLIICSVAVCYSVYWPCESDDDCTAENSKCSPLTGLCECESFDFVFSDDYSRCLKASLFGDTCEETFQCNLMPSGANCKSGVCDCADGHTYVRGQCRPLNGLNQPCDTDLDCYFGYDRESITCHNQVCMCANGYYHRNGNICRRKATSINDACVVDTDCDELGTGVKCVNLLCQVSNEKSAQKINDKKSVKSNEDTESINSPIEIVNGRNDLTVETDSESGQTSREIAVQTSLDAFELKPLNAQVKHVGTATSLTSINSIKRPLQRQRRSSSILKNDDEDKTLSTISNTADDDVDDKKYGSSCTDNGKSCAGLPHSICANNICLCRQGYYNRNDKCFAELGEIAESADECEFDYNTSTNKCICQKNYFYERNLRSCRKPIQYHLSCTSNSQCSPFGAAYCHPEIPRRCKCVEYAEYNMLQQMCLYKEGLGAECESNDGCPVQNSICSNSRCVCKPNFFEKNDVCLPGVGAECDDNDDCKVDESVCEATSSGQEKSCQCRKGFVHFQDECLKEAEKFEDECIDSEQCKPLLATCIDNKCICSPDQHLTYGRCDEKKELGEACTRLSECYVENNEENVECRNSVCQCKVGYQSDVEKKSCIRVKKNSSGRPSALKIITFLLIGSAFLITSAAIKQAYY